MASRMEFGEQLVQCLLSHYTTNVSCHYCVGWQKEYL